LIIKSKVPATLTTEYCKPDFLGSVCESRHESKSTYSADPGGPARATIHPFPESDEQLKPIDSIDVYFAG